MKKGQGTKSKGRMPWHREPTKDVVSCEKPRGAASKHRSVDVRMGKPTQGEPCVSNHESIVVGRETGGTETSKYPKEEKETSIP